MDDNHLGDFLRARRAGLRPEDVGMASYGVRRVAGLRREEVAVLAGVNADYYTRLEQGRERHPSPQVLDALGRALHLDTDARAHLYRLAGAPAQDQSPAHVTEQVTSSLRQLMDGYAHTPAFVMSRNLDLLATNALTDALYAPFTPADNLARMTFIDPASRTGSGRPRPRSPICARQPVLIPTAPGYGNSWAPSRSTARPSRACGRRTPCAARRRTPSTSSTRT